MATITKIHINSMDGHFTVCQIIVQEADKVFEQQSTWPGPVTERSVVEAMREAMRSFPNNHVH